MGGDRRARLVGAPGLILFDEQARDWRPRSSATCWRRSVNCGGGGCFLIVEQNAEIALSVADHAASSTAGRIAWTGMRKSCARIFRCVSGCWEFTDG